ncbi:MAG TPA: DUF1489 domain-containing protein [Alphaproteobacteria bacterium]|jgi:hypothetical protein
MPLHLVKMAVGAESLEHLAAWQKTRLAAIKAERGKSMLIHKTRNYPKRAEEILAGGSIYWIIKGFIRVHQRILGFERVTDAEGKPRCEIHYSPKQIRTVPVAHKPMQGWRYMEDEAAPRDLTGKGDVTADMPPEMLAELRKLGLL